MAGGPAAAPGAGVAPGTSVTGFCKTRPSALGGKALIPTPGAGPAEGNGVAGTNGGGKPGNGNGTMGGTAPLSDGLDGALGTAFTIVLATGGKLPRLAKANAGISRSSVLAPRLVASRAPRRVTDCSTQPSSMVRPTLMARAGLPSTEINANPPCTLASRGAATPTNLKRLACAGGAAATVAATGVVPKTRARSPRRPVPSSAETVYAGATGADVSKRKPQNMRLAATTAHIAKANKRANMR